MYHLVQIEEITNTSSTKTMAPQIPLSHLSKADGLV